MPPYVCLGLWVSGSLCFAFAIVWLFLFVVGVSSLFSSVLLCVSDGISLFLLVVLVPGFCPDSGPGKGVP